MDVQRLRELRRAQPFRPFGLVFPGGPVIEVHSPEYLAISPDGQTAAVFQPNHGPIDFVTITLVTEVELGRKASDQPGNW